jgi:hypothetical protein
LSAVSSNTATELNIDCSVSCIGMEKNVFTPGTTIFFPCKRVLVKPYLKI